MTADSARQYTVEVSSQHPGLHVFIELPYNANVSYIDIDGKDLYAYCYEGFYHV